MKVYISADIEGCTGLVSWSQCSRPDGQSFDYAFARRMMTHDINAAVRGARAGGATEIVVKDSHGNSKNLLIDELEPGVQLVSGYGGGVDGMMEGIDSSFDAAFLVGYHAMAGTACGVMEHTITGGMHRLSINGNDCGEIGLSAAAAGSYGVPLRLVVSDRAGCGEAVALIPSIEVAKTKVGLARYMARLLSPSETGPIIEAAARRALENRSGEVFAFSEPTTLRMEFNRSEETDMVAQVPSLARVNGYAVEGTFETFQAAHQVAWNAVELSFQGLATQR